ncbi:hypothetical protein [Phytomonospora endophytica]|uniref:Uncharacterized protein n=1 Tax=Phytomonospora endophytica TaxID=714109 RepID=A0A841FRK3_9ACTN|nr:hypothetical protein [Phytomonospora endophytica]MBB6037443.1 hypothetical protein [Phytomonospora endophytica]GIG70693.1 hypothetical protein Pen01_69880 [Phytomonospora endophytica]
MNLETRYRHLLRLYPRSWRDLREEEMVATYLDLAPPERTRPSMRDGLDVAGGALREWTRTVPPGFAGGARIAGVVGLSGVGMLSALLFFGIETKAGLPWEGIGFGDWGPFQTPAAVPWLAWMAIALAAPILQGPWIRRAGLFAQLATGALSLIEPTLERVPLEPFILLAMVVTGGTALLYVRGGTIGRVLPPLSTVAGAVIALGTVPEEPLLYTEVLYQFEWLRNTGVAVAAAALVALVISGLLRRAEGAWAFILLGPAVWALTYNEVTGYLGFGGIHGSYLVFDGFHGRDVVFGGFLLGVGVFAALVALVRLVLRMRSRTHDPQAS